MLSEDQMQVSFSEANGGKWEISMGLLSTPSESRAAGPGDWRPGQQQGAIAQGR